MTIEVTAKKVDDAINQGLAQLGVTLDKVTVEVLEQGGLFRKAKVRLTLDEPEQKAERPAVAEVKAKTGSKAATDKKPVTEIKPTAPATAEKAKAERPAAPKPKKTEAADKPVADKPENAEKTAPAAKANKPVVEKKKPTSEPAAAKSVGDTDGAPVQKPRVLRDEDKAAAAKALEFVKTVIGKMGFGDSVVEAGSDPEHIDITAPSGDDSLIIGRHGETLSALSYLAETGARAEKCHVNITVDCNGYRDRRAASLTAMAHRRANECASKHRKIKLEPMERVDRRTIHNALTDDSRVTTASEGKEPHRYIVIYPAESQRR